MLSRETLLTDSGEVIPFQVRSRREVRLGPVRVDLRCNENNFQGLRFFPEGRNLGVRTVPGEAPHFTVSLCNLGRDGPWPLETLATLHDKSYRGKKMSAGYYLTDHFGGPAFLISRGSRYWIFAQDFEPILWPYLVKHLLTVYSINQGMMHLKAAGVAVDGQGALLVGRGGSGKTFLLTHLCRGGAQFLSNTHVLIDGTELLGIPTAMRVRPDKLFAPIIAERGLSPSVKAGEYIADPLTDLGWKSTTLAPVRSICLVDYKGPASHTIAPLDRAVMFDYMEQLALAINVYGLKEDILDALDSDITRFSVEMTRTRAALTALVEGARCYYLSCDASQPRALRTILGLLAGERLAA